MNLASKIASEIELKVNLCNEGVRIEESALEGVGTKYLEDVRVIFDFNRYGYKHEVKIPCDIILPEGTVCKVNSDIRSPYFIRREDGTLVLEKNGKFVSPVQWPERPKYYDKKTSDGTEMKRLGATFGECRLLFCLTTTCNYFVTGDECKFCNMNPTGSLKETDSLLAEKRAKACGEVYAAYLEEGVDICLTITGGALPDKKGHESAIRIIESIKEHTGLESLPRGLVCLEPPEDMSLLDRLHATGIGHVGYNLEIWNPDMFRYICPGKHKKVGRDRWLRSLEYAVSLFGRGHVYSGIVTGLEAKESYYEAAHQLAEMGVLILITPWMVNRGSRLELHRPPHTEWLLEVNEKTVDIMAGPMPEVASEKVLFDFPNGCYRCLNLPIVLDEIRRRLGGVKKVMPKER